jgi:hypothetical protein
MSYKVASNTVWLGEVEAPDETAAIEKAAPEFKEPAGHLTYRHQPRGRKGELTHADLERKWPHHVASGRKDAGPQEQ